MFCNSVPALISSFSTVNSQATEFIDIALPGLKYIVYELKEILVC
jgi:hypothetical protein